MSHYFKKVAVFPHNWLSVRNETKNMEASLITYIWSMLNISGFLFFEVKTIVAKTYFYLWNSIWLTWRYSITLTFYFTSRILTVILFTNVAKMVVDTRLRGSLTQDRICQQQTAKRVKTRVVDTKLHGQLTHDGMNRCQKWPGLTFKWLDHTKCMKWKTGILYCNNCIYGKHVYIYYNSLWSKLNPHSQYHVIVWLLSIALSRTISYQYSLPSYASQCGYICHIYEVWI